MSKTKANAGKVLTLAQARPSLHQRLHAARGQTLVEYVMIVSIVSVAAISGLKLISVPLVRDFPDGAGYLP